MVSLGRFNRARSWAVVGALSLGALPFGSLATAVADPGTPADPVTQTPTAQVVTNAAAPAPESTVPTATPAPLNGVSHLPSPDSLPPGTTQAAPEQQSLGYLRDLFHAVRDDDVTMKEALLLLAQHPMNVPTTSASSGHSGEAPVSASAPVEPAPAPQPASP